MRICTHLFMRNSYNSFVRFDIQGFQIMDILKRWDKAARRHSIKSDKMLLKRLLHPDNFPNQKTDRRYTESRIMTEYG